MEFTTEWLAKQGIKGSKAELETLRAFVQAEWELRVGMILSEKFTPEQLAEFERINAKDEDGAAIAFLDKVYPDYPAIVAEQADKLQAEISASRNKTALIRSWDPALTPAHD